MQVAVPVDQLQKLQIFLTSCPRGSEKFRLWGGAISLDLQLGIALCDLAGEPVQHLALNEGDAVLS